MFIKSAYPSTEKISLENGLIIDIAAAEILTDRGIDVGIKNIASALGDSSASLVEGMEEHFLNDNNYISIRGAKFYDIDIHDKAEILSDIETENGKIPLSYRYENADGNRFLVLNINTRFNDSSMLKHYARGRQFADNIHWLSGNNLPAYVYGHPSLYIQAKEKDDRLAVGLWNFYADIAIDPVVELGKDYSDIKFINCDGQLDKNKVYLNNISPFTFVGFEVK